MKTSSRRHFRILVTLTVLFTVLITAFGMVLAVYVYDKSSDLLLKGSKQFFSQVRQELAMDYTSVQKTVAQTVHIVARTDVINATALEDRLRFVPLFYSALRNEPKLTALQVGYDNGDYFIVRALNSDYMIEQFNAPPLAAVVVDNITTEKNGRRYRERFWYTDSMIQIKQDVPVRDTYDPRIRPWYKAALSSTTVKGSEPYLFHFIRQMGITVALKPTGADCVIAGDITLQNLSMMLSEYETSNRTELVLLEEKDNKFWVVGYKDTEKLVVEENNTFSRAQLKDLGKDILDAAVASNELHKPFFKLRHKDEDWLGSTGRLDISGREDFYLVMLAPENEILLDARKMQMQTRIFTLFMLVLAGPLTWLLARQIAQPLQLLAKNTERISRFEFTPGGHFDRSVIKEVDDLGQAMSKMEITIDQFLTLINSLASEQDFDKLLIRISEETMKIGEADGAFTYIVSATDSRLTPGSIHTGTSCIIDDKILPEYRLSDDAPLVKILKENKRVIADLSDIIPGNALSTHICLQSATVVIFPAVNRQNETIGLLCLVYESEKFGSATAQEGRLAFLEALSGFAAVTLESRQMLRMQKNLLESFIKVLADAIDSKSPYTGGHCKRVPVLARLLAQKAAASHAPPFHDFNPTEEEWEALRIASWLHDCGKVTTPEYIVDKSTKLETIHDRIHEIRMRFEVLKRDAHIECLENLSTGYDQDKLASFLQARWKELDDEFAYVAQCNIGSELMKPEKVKKLKEISSRTWQRTINDRLGISWEELQRKKRTPEKTLPATAHLIDDLDEHLVARDESRLIGEDNPYSFILDTPKNHYNRGELYNLSIPRGTLTDEDRFQINDHIVQTIIMLKQLPFPKYLASVPEIAGGHHEKLDGTGYPKKLKGDEMSMEAKIMVIADIFEALTAVDRPYKKAIILSDSIQIMSNMVNNGHIDPDLFRLFLSSGAYLEYAKGYLKPEQIDTVDVERFIEASI